MNRQYPQLEINLPKLRHNTREVVQRCRRYGISVCGVIKGADSHPDVARAFLDGGATELATSRIEQIIRCREAGIPGPYLLLRVPMLSELEDVVRWCDTSLESDVTVLDALEEACIKQDKTHRVIVMADLGDLREGFWDKEEMVSVCAKVEVSFCPKGHPEQAKRYAGQPCVAVDFPSARTPRGSRRTARALRPIRSR